MRVVVCRVDSAVCTVDETVSGEIHKGLLLYAGFHIDDTRTDVIKTAQKVSKLRIFTDEKGKISLSAADIGGSALVIPNFTLYGRVKGSHRPDFMNSCPFQPAKDFFELFKKTLSEFLPVESGIFGAHMHITAQNDGPVTLVINSEEL